ncbi:MULTISPECIES: hypothetical protein [Thermomonosporaceae]|nr:MULTISPECIES: hypothetical protein [Thermomonosporaceae]MDL4776506.1 hypothetical protein [Actinomadura xylanilytica]
MTGPPDRGTASGARLVAIHDRLREDLDRLSDDIDAQPGAAGMPPGFRSG